MNSKNYRKNKRPKSKKIGKSNQSKLIVADFKQKSYKSILIPPAPPRSPNAPAVVIYPLPAGITSLNWIEWQAWQEGLSKGLSALEIKKICEERVYNAHWRVDVSVQAFGDFDRACQIIDLLEKRESAYFERFKGEIPIALKDLGGSI